MDKTKEEAITRKGDLEGKPQWSLTDFSALQHLTAHSVGGWHGVNWNALECMVRVLEFGAKKYEVNGWRKGYLVSKCMDSLYRHVIALARGEKNDQETGISHYGHILCNLMFISWWIENRPELDDRPKCNLDYAVHLDPTTEPEAIDFLMQALTAFAAGVNFDSCSDRHILGFAMHCACLGYSFQNSVHPDSYQGEIIENEFFCSDRDICTCDNYCTKKVNL